MEYDTVVLGRRSIRGYLPKPVPKALIKEVLGVAMRASLPGFTLLCHLGAFINGIGGPILMAAPIQISAAWFPPEVFTNHFSVSQCID